MKFSLLHPTLRLRIDFSCTSSYVDCSHSGKPMLDLLCRHSRVIGVVTVEAFVTISNRRAVTGIREQHGARRSVRRFDAKDGNIGVNNPRRVGTEIILAIFSEHPPVYTKMGLPAPKPLPRGLQIRKRPFHSIEYLVANAIFGGVKLP